MYTDQPLQDYLHALASEQSTPGGGSAAALSGAMGAALASMVCRLTLGKEAYAGVRQEIEELLRRAENLRSRFQQLFQEDIEAYGRLSASYELLLNSGAAGCPFFARLAWQLITRREPAVSLNIFLKKLLETRAQILGPPQ